MRYYEIINEGYREVRAKFVDSAREETVDEMIAAYRDLVSRNQIHGDQRNIDWWGKQGWREFKSFVQSKSGQSSSTQRKRKKSAGNSVTLYEDDWVLAIIPLDRDASCFHGRDTKWCTAVHDRFYFIDYFHGDETTLVYFFMKETGDKYAASVNIEYPEDSEFFDQEDNVIDENQFENIVGYDSRAILELIDEHPTANIDIERERKRINNLLSLTKQRVQERVNDNQTNPDPELELDLIQSANFVQAYYYAAHMFEHNGRMEYSNEFKRLLLNTHGADGIRFIKNVNERDVKFALEFEPRILENIYNKPDYAHLKSLITDSLLETVLEKHPRMIAFIRDPNPTWQMNCVKRDPNTISFIKFPDKSVQEYVIRAEPRYIHKLKQMDVSVQQMVVDKYPDRIRNLPYMSPEVQMYAVKQNPKLAVNIRELLPAVRELAIKQAPELETKLS